MPTVSVQPQGQAIGLVQAPKVILAQAGGGCPPAAAAAAGQPVSIAPLGGPKLIVPAQSVTLLSTNGSPAAPAASDAQTGENKGDGRLGKRVASSRGSQPFHVT